MSPHDIGIPATTYTGCVSHASAVVQRAAAPFMCRYFDAVYTRT